MDRINQILKDHQIRVTPQRLCVLAVLRDAEGHKSADDICRNVRREMPGVSLATVYSVLEHLRNKGLVQEIKIDFEKSLYEIKESEHHHFLCHRCHTVYDIDIHPCPTLKNKNIRGHIIDDFQGYFYGICNNCNSKNNRKK